ncbi:MAG: GNAT family N-acetyltransferase [Micromonosporaceae bacterium]
MQNRYVTDIQIHAARFGELDPTTLYALLKLRVDIFVVEQECPYPELDGRDTEPTAWHVWAASDGELLGYLRVLQDPDGTARIGRVCTAAAGRGRGVAGGLMARAIAEIGDRPSRLDAQSYLVGFYARYGYSPTGPEYVEDGIPHVPMARPATAGDATAAPR